MNHRSFLAPALLAVCLGCATIGTRIDPQVVATFQPGVTTKDQAIAALGRPTSYVLTSQGETQLVWTWAHGTAFGGAQAESYQFMFGSDGVLKGKTVSVVDHTTPPPPPQPAT